MQRDVRRRMREGAVLLALLVGAAGTAAAQRAGVRGTVRDAEDHHPLAQVQVTVGGGTIGALTDAQGVYHINNVLAGQVEVRARMIGYRVVAKVVAIPSQGDVEVNFDLAPSALSLDEYVVTASGQEQSAREVPSANTTVNLADLVDNMPIKNMTDALTTRAAGVTVMSSSGTTGAGARIRIRGAGSLSLSNEPVVYIDGVRVENGASSNSIGVGGQVPSRINDLNPEEIESYQVIRGPAAAALYGTDAANGIINIRTRRGRSGPAVWRAYAEGGNLSENTAWPDNIFGFDTTKAATSALRYGCTLSRQSLGQCTQNGGLFHMNPLTNDRPFRDGNHTQLGASISGGSERITYFFSGDVTRENGIYVTNSLSRSSMRANVTAAINPRFDLGVQSGYTNSRLRLPDNDNNALGYLGSGLLGNADTTRRGWGFLLPEQVNLINTLQDVDRFTSGVTADYRPLSWLTMHGVAGIDRTSRFDTRTIEPNQVPFNQTSLDGSRVADPIQIWNWNAKASAQARLRLTPTLTSQTTAGLDFFHSRFSSIFASGRKLAAGTSSLAGIGIPTVSEDLTESRTFGVYMEEVVGWRDRVYLTGSLRRDDNSAFGRNFNAVTYPKLGVSWVLSDESFFPRTRVLSTVRLRSAYGVLGLAPGATDALLFFNPVAVTADNTDQVAFQVGNLGNPNLKPERVQELELGFDAGFFRDRMNVVFTYYNKTSHDALISRVLAPSLGVSSAQFFNLGQVNNKGFEFELSGRALDRHAVALDLGVSLWHNTNNLVDIGHDPLGNPIPSIVFGNSQQHRQGFPLGSYWVRPITAFNDANADGIITSGEVTLDTAFHYVGPVFPTHGIGFTPTLTLFSRVRLSATIDHRAGHYLYNFTADFRCRQNICPEMNDPATPLARQAQAVSDVFLGQPNGYIEKADFTKLRELSLTYLAPASWARMVKGSAVSFTLAGRNLHTWTSYTGVDPEVNQNGQANFSTADFLTQPPVKYWTFRVNYTF